MILEVILITLYFTQIIGVTFMLLVGNVFETKKEFLLQLIPFYFIYKKYKELD